MCLMLPGHVLAVEDDAVLIERGGFVTRVTSLLEPDLKTGDWVVVSGGAVVRKVTPEQAMAIAVAVERSNVEPTPAASRPTPHATSRPSR